MPFWHKVTLQYKLKQLMQTADLLSFHSGIRSIPKLPLKGYAQNQSYLYVSTRYSVCQSCKSIYCIIYKLQILFFSPKIPRTKIRLSHLSDFLPLPIHYIRLCKDNPRNYSPMHFLSNQFHQPNHIFSHRLRGRTGAGTGFWEMWYFMNEVKSHWIIQIIQPLEHILCWRFLRC